jgi:hypothetical protein
MGIPISTTHRERSPAEMGEGDEGYPSGVQIPVMTMQLGYEKFWVKLALDRMNFCRKEKRVCHVVVEKFF